MQPAKRPIRPEVRTATRRAMIELEPDLEYLRAYDSLDPERFDIVGRALLRLTAEPIQDSISASLPPNLPSSKNLGHT